MKFTIKKCLLTLAIGLISISIIGGNIDYVSASEAPDYIRIGLKYGSSSQSEYTLYFENGIKLGVGTNDSFTELASFDDINKVVIGQSAGSVSVTGIKSSGETVILNEGLANANCIMPGNYENGGTVSLENSKYRGGILFLLSSGNLTAINYLPMEEYLYGVINGELSKSYPKEALKAQAVAARSYAVCKLNTHNSNGFDLCATTHCQVYKGYGDEYPETTAAVEETEGDTINYDGKAVAAFFYKNSGGYTQSSEDVWGGKEGYLRAVKDEYSPVYPWTQIYNFAELSSKLSAAGHHVGTLTNVAITKRNQSGAVDTLQFTGTGGTVTLQKNKIRGVLGSTAIKSTMFSFAESGSPGIVTGVFSAHVVSGPKNSAVELPDKVYIINGKGETEKLPSEDLYVHNGKETKNIEDMTQGDSGAGGIVGNGLESVSGGTATFTGRGYGHGIGLPQDSAVEMAKQGFTYKEILNYYYTDITID